MAKRDAEGYLVVRNPIYARLFDRRWVESTTPKRALAGYRSWAIAASVALVILGAGSLGVVNYLGSQLSEREQLAQLNITVVAAERGSGNRIAFPKNASQEVLEEAVPLLKGVASVTELVLDGANVADLTPLQGLTNLELLWFDNTKVKDLTPVQNLTGLRSLTFNNTQVSEVGPLAGLTNLQRLFLNNTQVADVGPLAGLTNLQRLWLDNTQVSEEEVARLKEALPDLRVIQ